MACKIILPLPWQANTSQDYLPTCPWARGREDTDMEYSSTSSVIFMEYELVVTQKHGTFNIHCNLYFSSALKQVFRHAPWWSIAADHVVRGSWNSLGHSNPNPCQQGGSKLLFSNRRWANGSIWMI